MPVSPALKVDLGPTEATYPVKTASVGLIANSSASRAEDPGFESRLRRDFSVVESNTVN